jgi:hypothetical protein
MGPIAEKRGLKVKRCYAEELPIKQTVNELFDTY